MYEESVLLKLRRTYSESEAVQFISDKLRECQTENGKLKSELEHYKHLLRIEKSKERNFNKLRDSLKDKERRIFKLENKVKGMKRASMDNSQEVVMILRRPDYDSHWQRIFELLNRNSFL